MITQTSPDQPLSTATKKPSRERVASSSLADRRLVDRCLAGDVAAWDQLYGQCQPPLLLAIRVFLGANSRKQDLIEDIAAKVWFTVIDGQSELLNRFDAQRGCRLTTFLAGVAKNEISRYLRAERRRQNREAIASRARLGATRHSAWESLLGADIALTEFLATLTPREREFCEGHLLARQDLADGEYSQANRWQLQHRVRRKLWQFLEQD
jgi:DNA-directed RNA polymerase specialized sigma24 family protein